MSSTRLRTKKTIESMSIRDFVEDDARVIVTESFRPTMSRMFERGEYLRLSDPVVRAFPMYFALAIPVSDVLLGEIER